MCLSDEALRFLGKRVLYFDTDSVVFLEDTDDPQQPQPVLGDYLGEFTNELDRVVTRYMGSGITASGSGSWTRDPGSQVMGSGSANFFWSWRGSRIDRFLDTLFFMRNKNIPFCKEKGLFSGLLKKLLTFILLTFTFNLYPFFWQSSVKISTAGMIVSWRKNPK